jgi:hypothetical protein
MRTSTGKPTKAQAEHFERLQLLGCVACRKKHGIARFPVEMHHLISGSRRRGHDFVLPLCSWHHRGVTEGGMNANKMMAYHGPSFALNPKMFRIHFGTDLELLAEVNGLMENVA